jgi:hypothetical protein
VRECERESAREERERERESNSMDKDWKESDIVYEEKVWYYMCVILLSCPPQVLRFQPEVVVREGVTTI